MFLKLGILFDKQPAQETTVHYFLFSLQKPNWVTGFLLSLSETISDILARIEDIVV